MKVIDCSKILVNFSCFWLFCLSGACSSTHTEKVQKTTDSASAKLSQPSLETAKKLSQNKAQTSLPKVLPQRPKLEACFDDEGLERVWTKKTLSWQACHFSTQLFQCKGVLGNEGDGAIVRWALVKDNGQLTTQKTVSTSVLQAQVLWTAIIASEEIPNAHAERIYTKTKLLPNKAKPNAQSACRSFKAQRIQSARSFNLVDARESEFDEADIDEISFEYDLTSQQYKALEVEEEEFKIKVRSH